MDLWSPTFSHHPFDARVQAGATTSYTLLLKKSNYTTLATLGTQLPYDKVIFFKHAKELHPFTSSKASWKGMIFMQEKHGHSPKPIPAIPTKTKQIPKWKQQTTFTKYSRQGFFLLNTWYMCSSKHLIIPSSKNHPWMYFCPSTVRLPIARVLLPSAVSMRSTDRYEGVWPSVDDIESVRRFWCINLWYFVQLVAYYHHSKETIALIGELQHKVLSLFPLETLPNGMGCKESPANSNSKANLGHRDSWQS